MELPFDEPPIPAVLSPATVHKLARNLISGEVILKRGNTWVKEHGAYNIVDSIEVLDKVIKSGPPKRVLVWSTDDLHYEFGIDESVEIACD